MQLNGEVAMKPTFVEIRTFSWLIQLITVILLFADIDRGSFLVFKGLYDRLETELLSSKPLSPYHYSQGYLHPVRLLLIYRPEVSAAEIPSSPSTPLDRRVSSAHAASSHLYWIPSSSRLDPVSTNRAVNTVGQGDGVGNNAYVCDVPLEATQEKPFSGATAVSYDGKAIEMSDSPGLPSPGRIIQFQTPIQMNN